MMIELPDGGMHLSRLHHIKIKNEELRIKETEIVGLSDVTKSFAGRKERHLRTRRRKEQQQNKFAMLDEALKHYASIIERNLHRDVSHFPGSGAAGGLGAGLIAFCNAKIVSGIDYVLDMIRFDISFNNAIVLSRPKERWTLKRFKAKESKVSLAGQKGSRKPVHAIAGKILGTKQPCSETRTCNSFVKYRRTKCRLRKQ